MNKYSHCQFIFLGDMNASFIKPQPTKRDINFMSAMEDMNFVLPNNYPLDMTYHHYNGFATSQIDYILPFRDKSFVKVLQQECTNTSTHDLVIGHIFGHFVKVKKDKRDEPDNCIINNKINWNTIDKQTYQTMLTQDFQEELSVIGDTSDYINKLAETLMKCALQSCDVKQTKIVGKKGRKPWTPEISTLVRAARDAHQKWKEHGQGRTLEMCFSVTLKRLNVI